MKATLDPGELVVSIISATPDHRVRGKKRLQKFAYLLKSVGVKCQANFKIWDFGPFSSEVARATEWLSLSGELKEQEEQVGQMKMFMTVYSLTGESRQLLEPRFVKILGTLDAYSTTELEVAATVQYFLKQGCTVAKATKCVKDLKPTKALPDTIEKSFSLIKEIEAIH